jgi:hypothetical protein
MFGGFNVEIEKIKDTPKEWIVKKLLDDRKSKVKQEYRAKGCVGARYELIIAIEVSFTIDVET